MHDDELFWQNCKREFLNEDEGVEAWRITTARNKSFMCRRMKPRFCNQYRVNKEIWRFRETYGRRHFLKVYASVTTCSDFGILFQPAPVQTLDKFLGNSAGRSAYLYRRDSEFIITQLKQAFGCIAGGLAWCHSRSISFGNLTPRNIMIHERSFVFSISARETGPFELEKDPVKTLSQETTWLISTRGDDNITEADRDVFMLISLYVEILDGMLALVASGRKGPWRATKEWDFAMRSLGLRLPLGEEYNYLDQIFQVIDDNDPSRHVEPMYDADAIAGSFHDDELRCDWCRIDNGLLDDKVGEEKRATEG